MQESFDPGPLLARSYSLARGPRVCLRLARPRDAAGIADLPRTRGQEPGELELARLVRCDPRRRLVLVATALIDAVETVVGVGAIDLASDGEALPTFVVVDERRTGGLAELLTAALLGRARIMSRVRAA